MSHASLAALALATLAPALPAQALQVESLTPDVRAELDLWRVRTGAGWEVHADRGTGYVEMLFGAAVSGPFVPASDAEWIELARYFVRETRSLHGVSDGDLTRPRVVFLPLGMGNGSDKVTVRLQQEAGGVPIDGGAVNALFDAGGRLLSVHSTASPFVSGMSTAPATTAEFVAESAARLFARSEGLAPLRLSVPELVFARIERNGARRPVLAWLVEAANEANGEEPRGWRYTLDARSGALLSRETTIHHFDVTGKVQTMASPGVLPDVAVNPPVPLDAGYVRLTSSAGSVFADRDGNFNFPGVNTPLDITVRYSGTFNDVDNSTGSDYVITFPNVQPGQTNTLLMNPSPMERTTAQANGYLHIGTMRDFIRDTVPTDGTADFQADSNVNINNFCNAFYSGGSVNYYLAGGGCINTAYTTLVGHEFGHWLNDRYGTGNGPDGMGEGNADTWAMYAFDTPIVGELFRDNGSFIRSGENTSQFCGDVSPNCHSGVHASGRVWMGAAWKIRARMNATLGNTLGDATADGLFVSWMNAYNQSTIRSIIETQWLTLDDDDGNLSNGTPNFTEIDGGFRDQGFPGRDVGFVQFSGLTQLANTVDEVGPYVVFVDAVAQFAPPVADAQLLYSVNGGPLMAAPMTNVGGDTYRGEIPGQLSPASVRYHVAATDSAGDGNLFPLGSPDEALEFAVGLVTTFLSSGFEGPGDDGWTVGSPGDSATDGLWVRGAPRGTEAQPGDDHSPAPGSECWFTGQGAPGGSNNADDVDGGSTSLVSPVFDASGLTDPEISYWRWFTSAHDLFRVDLSNDGGQTWSEAESIENGNSTWTRHSFALRSVLPLTSTMRLRFVCADIAFDSLVEAALDDILGRDVTSACLPPAEFCPTTPNSAGAGAVISFASSQSVTENDVTLYANGGPSSQFGLFLYGLGQTSFPLGEGTLCVDLPFTRLPIVQLDILGWAPQNLDLSARPASEITPGTTWNFQFWYRDPSGGAAGFNFSNAISVQFCE